MEVIMTLLRHNRKVTAIIAVPSFNCNDTMIEIFTILGRKIDQSMGIHYDVTLAIC